MPIRTFLVDDSPETLEVLSILFELHPNTELVGTGNSAESAWRQIENLELDLISIDIQLGSESGFDLCAKIRQSFPNVYISMCSVEADSSMQQQAIKSGANFFLPKPLSYEDVQRLIAHVDGTFVHQTDSDTELELTDLMKDLLGT